MEPVDEIAREPGRRGRLKRRAEFLRVGKGRRWHGRAMTLQVECRDGIGASPDRPPRFGFTLTKKVGCAVVRNRARRRLREAVRLAPRDLPARPGHDYVVVGRVEALRVPFTALGHELASGLVAVHASGRRRDGRKGGGRHVEHDGPSGIAPDARSSRPPAETPGRGAPERIRPKP